jgi:hypothetical protein
MLVPPLALLVGWLLGGRWEGLLAVRLRWAGVILGAFAAQWLLVRLPEPRPLPWLGAALLATYGLIATFLWVNRRLPGLGLALVGTLLNMAVIGANGGFMPITPTTLAALPPPTVPLIVGQRVPRSKDVLLPVEQAQLAGLGDTLVCPAPINQAFSPGDGLVALGIGGLIVGAMTTHRRQGWNRPALPLAPSGVGGPPGDLYEKEERYV